MNIDIPDLDAAEEAARQSGQSAQSGSLSSKANASARSTPSTGRESRLVRSAITQTQDFDAKQSHARVGRAIAPNLRAVVPPQTVGPAQLSELPESHVARQAKGPAAADPTRILVSPRQRGNPLLGLIRNVPWRYEERCRADFELGRGVGSLFLSLRYHLRYPKYARVRMRDVHGYYTLRLLLILSDVDDPTRPLSEVCREACQEGFTAIVAWSPAEAARYIETYKAYEKKSAKHIQAPRDLTAGQAIAGALTAVRGINSTDVVTIAGGVPPPGNKGGGVPGEEAKGRPAAATFADLLRCPGSVLRAMPGLGDKKVDRLLAAVTRPLRPSLPPDPVRRQRLGLQPVGAGGLPVQGHGSAMQVRVQVSMRQQEEDEESVGEELGAGVRASSGVGAASGAKEVEDLEE